jgi:tetratricopeptide (TPR) repeat protein
LLELARLKFDQKQYDNCIPYFRNAIGSMEKINAPVEAPAEFAIVLDEYAKALQETGRKQESISILARANEIRAKNQGQKSITDRTPMARAARTEII